MSFYPILLNLSGKTALVVGGGKVAQRKVESLLEYGATVHIVSRELTSGLRNLVKAGRVRCLGKVFHERQLHGVFLVIAATDDKLLNKTVSHCARERGLLINAADQPAECNFIVPSVVRRGDLLIAISTSGKSPALAKKTRKELEKKYGKEYETLLILMGRLRKAVLSRGLPQKENRRIFNEILDSEIIAALSKGNREAIELCLKNSLPKDLPVEDLLDGLIEP